jgi:hypothetical protein
MDALALGEWTRKIPRVTFNVPISLWTVSDQVHRKNKPPELASLIETSYFIEG